MERALLITQKKEKYYFFFEREKKTEREQYCITAYKFDVSLFYKQRILLSSQKMYYFISLD